MPKRRPFLAFPIYHVMSNFESTFAFAFESESWRWECESISFFSFFPPLLSPGYPPLPLVVAADKEGMTTVLLYVTTGRRRLTPVEEWNHPARSEETARFDDEIIRRGGNRLHRRRGRVVPRRERELTRRFPMWRDKTLPWCKRIPCSSDPAPTVVVTTRQ
jgi:hypothetical protein